MVATVIKRAIIPVLLLGSMFSPLAGPYEERLVTAIWVAASISVLLALRWRDYFMAGGMCAVAIVFSPLVLPFKIFALLGFACVVAIVAVGVVWKLRTVHPAQ
jgi:hypothetical protein